MNAGALRQRITIQSVTFTQDAELNAIESWADVATLWAEALPQNGREFYRLQTTNSEISMVFRIRYNSGVTPHMRVRFRDQPLAIVSVINPGEANVELLLGCKGVI